MMLHFRNTKTPVQLDAKQASTTAVAVGSGQPRKKASDSLLPPASRVSAMDIAQATQSRSPKAQPDAVSASGPYSQMDQVAFMQQCRRQIIAEEGYLLYGELETVLIRQFGNKRFWSRDLSDATLALRRVLTSVEAAIDAVLATHAVVALRDLQEMLMKVRQFRQARSFDELGIGALVRNRRVQTHFRPSPAALERGEVPDVTAAEVVARLVQEIGRGGALASTTSSDELSRAIQGVLDALARRKGFEQGRDLCVHIKAESLLVWMLDHSRQNAQRLKEDFDRAADRLEAAESYTKLLGAVTGPETLEDPQWWRSVQKSVCSRSGAFALRLVRRLLMSLPEVLGPHLDGEDVARDVIRRDRASVRYVCPDCGLGFASFNDCRAHVLLTGHAKPHQSLKRRCLFGNADPAASTKRVQEGGGETFRKYRCPDCLSGFKIWKSFRNHLIETGHAQPHDNLKERCRVRDGDRDGDDAADDKEEEDGDSDPAPVHMGSTAASSTITALDPATAAAAHPAAAGGQGQAVLSQKDSSEVWRATAGRVVEVRSQLIVCAMRQLPLESETGRALLSFDEERIAADQAQAVAAAAALLRSKPPALRLDTVRDLYTAELALSAAQPDGDGSPSLLRLLLEHEDFKGLIAASPPDAGPAEARESEAAREMQVAPSAWMRPDCSMP